MEKTFNESVAEQIYKLGQLEQNVWKKRAYYHASMTLKNYPEDLEEKDDYLFLDGVGHSINGKIKEFKKSGEIRKLNILAQIKAEPIKSLKPKTFSRHEVLERLGLVFSRANRQRVAYEICGSWRRGLQKIGDVDLLILENEMPIWKGILGITIVKGKDKAIDAVVNDVRVNLRVTRQEGWGAGLLYLTGSAEFNIRMRTIAKKKGLKLNQYGLFDSTGVQIAGSTEFGVFKALNMDYVMPEVRV